MAPNRSRRLTPPPYDDGEIVVEAPPAAPAAAPGNLVARLLPIVMVVAMGGMAVLYFRSGTASTRSPLFLLFPVMMLVSVLGSVAYGARGTRRTGEVDEGRRTYLRYLGELDASLRRTAAAQYQSLHWSYPDPACWWTHVGGARMWERHRDDADFGRVRIGVGPLRLSQTLVAPESRSAESSDPVTSAALARVLAERSTVPGLPVTIDLATHQRIVIEGSVDAARGLARAVLCQLAVLHGPQELVISTAGRAAADEWDWVKWLPHHRQSPDGGRSAHQVVIVDGGDRAADDRSASASASASAGVTVMEIAEAGSAERLGDWLIVDVDGCPGFDVPDALTRTQAVAFARRLARFSSGELIQTGPAQWPQLVGIGDLSLIDATELWSSRPGRLTLRVAIGSTERGEPVELDVKEAAEGGMGPHGLCIGATGSGKSEFLRTLVLGLVTTHSPSELNLVLVDFKGGATFLGLERLRHVAAVVTNLSDEAHLVARMRDALAGEMTRRQEVLRAAGGFANLKAYQAARVAGDELVALPALLVVVDEFAELLSQHPDFAELFVAIGRVGRSLGIHLLLASQRLDEGRLRGLETHLSYRICLKTFSASESRAVLGTADAYELRGGPGAAILKTASGELVRFQTAFVSGPVTTVEPAYPTTPRPFTAVTAAPRNTAGPGNALRALLDVVVDGLAERGEPAHRVWLPPLAAAPTLRSLLAADVPPRPLLTVPIGLVDNPFAQRRDPLTVDLRAAGGHVAIVGGPRAGKTTALHTLVMGLAATHDPDDVQIYGLDFGGGSISSLSALPHVGAIAGRFDRDLAIRLVAHVHGLVRTRETRRRRGDADGVGDCDTFLVVDGWAVARQEFDGMEDAVTAIAAQGLSVGVHVVVTASRWAEIRPALKDQLNTRIELRLGDPADSEMDRRRAKLLVDRPSGHGITRDGLEFVIARPRLADEWPGGVPPGGRDADLDVITRRFPGRTAPPVRLLPSSISHAVVAAQSPDDVALGLDGDDLGPLTVDFRAHPHLLILGDTECGKTSTLRLLCREIMRHNVVSAARILVVDIRRTLLGVVESGHLLGYAASASAADSHVAAAADTLSGRLPGERVTQRELRDRSWWSGPDVYVVVDDYDLVTGASGNPLLPLLDLLPHARDIGLHLVVARRSGGASRAMFDPVLARLRDVGCMGLMMSASPEEGVLLGSSRPTPLPPGRGVLVRRGQPERFVQVAWVEPA